MGTAGSTAASAATAPYAAAAKQPYYPSESADIEGSGGWQQQYGTGAAYVQPPPVTTTATHGRGGSASVQMSAGMHGTHVAAPQPVADSTAAPADGPINPPANPVESQTLTDAAGSHWSFRAGGWMRAPGPARLPGSAHGSSASTSRPGSSPTGSDGSGKAI